MAQKLKEKMTLLFIFSKIGGSEDKEVLVAEYNGGGDSGNIDLDVDFQQMLKDLGAEEYEDTILNHIDEKLGYGSWAGDFSAHGQVYWNGKSFRVEGWETTEIPSEIADFELPEEED